jgi:hypothetical protein
MDVFILIEELFRALRRLKRCMIGFPFIADGWIRDKKVLIGKGINYKGDL